MGTKVEERRKVFQTQEMKEVELQYSDLRKSCSHLLQVEGRS